MTNLKYLTIVALLFIGHSSFSQTSSFHDKMLQPQAGWMIKKGFSAQKYDWSNNQINSQLRAAVRSKKTSKVWAITSSIIVANATLAVMAASTLGGNNESNDSATMGYMVLGATGLSFVVVPSLLWSGKAKRKIRVAEKMRVQF